MVDLTSVEQSFLAELCSSLRSFAYAELTGKPLSVGSTENKILDTIDRFDMTPQKLDRLHALMHRTGANK